MRALAVGLLLLSLTIVGLSLAWQRNRITALGYGIRRLDIQRRQISERNRELECDIAALAVPTAIERRLQTFGIELVQPTELAPLTLEAAPINLAARRNPDDAGMR